MTDLNKPFYQYELIIEAWIRGFDQQIYERRF